MEVQKAMRGRIYYLSVIFAFFLLYLVHSGSDMHLYFSPVTNITSGKINNMYNRVVYIEAHKQYVPNKTGKYYQYNAIRAGKFEKYGAIQVGKYDRHDAFGSGGHHFENSFYPNDFVAVNGIRHLNIFGDITKDIKCGYENSITSHVFSRLYLAGVDHKRRTVRVVIQTYDLKNRSKTLGGDVIYLWAKKKTGQYFNRIGGRVRDHLNGTYTGELQMPWAGETIIEAKIVSSYRTSCMRVRAMAKYGNSAFANEYPYGIHYMFKNGNVSEMTRCSPLAFIHNYDNICNFTDLNFGLSWFCGKPVDSGLNCSDFHKFGMIEYHENTVAQRPYSDVIERLGINQLRQSLAVFFPKKVNTFNFDFKENCSKISTRTSWTRQYPSGYVFRGKWRINHCDNYHLDPYDIRKCLANKTIFLLGDSTIRQYLEKISKIVNASISTYPYHIDAISTKHNVSMLWKKHEMPFHNFGIKYTPDMVYSTAMEIRKIADDDVLTASDIVVLLHYNSHVQLYPPSVFRDRLRHLVPAIKYLVEKKPEAKILFKGPHTCHDDGKWFEARVALMFRDVLYEEFLSIRDHVTYLDVMSITVAYNNGDLHPSDGTLDGQVQQFLAYIC